MRVAIEEIHLVQSELPLRPHPLVHTHHRLQAAQRREQFLHRCPIRAVQKSKQALEVILLRGE